MVGKHFKTLLTMVICLTMPCAVWSIGEKRVTVLSQGAVVRDLKYSPNGQWLAVATSSVTVLYDALTLQQKHVLLKDGTDLSDTLGSGSSIDLSFSPNSKFLTYAANSTEGGNVVVWDVVTGTDCTAAHGLDVLDKRFRKVRFSPDGRTLAIVHDEVILWDIFRGEQRVIIEQEPGAASLRFRPDGKVLAGIVFNQHPPTEVVTFWDTYTGKPLGTAQEGAHSIDYSPNGHLFAVGLREGTELLSIDSNEVLHTFKNRRAMFFSPDSRFLATTFGDQLELWSVQTGQIDQTFKQEFISAFTFSPDGRTLVTGNPFQAQLKFWDVETGEKKRTIRWPTNRAASFHENGTLITAVADLGETTTLISWDIENAKSLKTINLRVQSVEAVRMFSPDGRGFAIGQSGSLGVWNTENGEMLWSRPQPFTSSGPIVFSGDGRFVATAHFQGNPQAYWVSVWETHSGIEYRRLPGRPSASLAFSPDGNMLAIGEPGGRNTLGIDEIGGKIRLFNVHTGAMTGELQGKQTRLRSLGFSPDGKILVSSGRFETRPSHSQQMLQLWDISTGKPLYMIEGSEDISKLVFSPDGRILAAAHGIGLNTVTLWSVSEGRELLTLGGVDADEGALAFSPDGQRLVTVGSATLVWNLPQLLDPFPPTSTTQLKQEPPVSQPLLLPNFPNPANPETWIPYQLHTDADVKIRIYDVRGRLVRLLNIGHRPPGAYTCHCKAAYWDGTNALGERVTSGVYFYTLSAGEILQTRKMVLKK